MDVFKVFREIIDCRENANGEREGFISNDKKDLLEYAFEAAVNAGKSGVWNYIDATLKNLRQRGITTLKQAEDYDIDREEGAAGA